jgi:hypothetical protein
MVYGMFIVSSSHTASGITHMSLVDKNQWKIIVMKQIFEHVHGFRSADSVFSRLLRIAIGTLPYSTLC